jgi:outer membrane protein
MKTNRSTSKYFLAAFLLLSASPSLAQDEDDAPKEPRRTRVSLGVQMGPSYPGSDRLVPRPLFDLSRSRGDKPFRFEAPDESFGFGLIKSGGFRAGPSANYEGSRTAKDVGAPMDKVGDTIEVGAFAQYQFGESFRIRGEGRKGLGGHDGWIGDIGADYIARNGDKWLFSIGPRVTLSDSNYQRAFFGVNPAESVRTGLAIWQPDGGVQAVGATAGLIAQFSRHWGIYTYAKYDRLVGDAGKSPVVRAFGSRDQLSGGLALSYTWGGNRKN